MVGWLLGKYRETPQKGRWKLHGTIGILIIVISEILMLGRVEPVATYFNAVVWTGYILLVDGLTYRLEGASLITTHWRRFLLLLPLGLVGYTIFESYNLKLHAWVYRYSVSSPGAWLLLFVWGWMQVFPALFETAWFLRALGVGKAASGPGRFAVTKTKLLLSFAFGLFLLAFPFVVTNPHALIRTLVPLGAFFYYGCMFFGFLLLLDPVNYSLSRHSLLADLGCGNYYTWKLVGLSGMICGILWEFWNYWATGKWIYVVPVMQDLKMFEMPLSRISVFNAD